MTRPPSWTGWPGSKQEIEDGDFPWDGALEDLHMNIERRLHQLIGPAAGRLHTGRSRNDQIALDMRLYTREVIADAIAGLRERAAGPARAWRGGIKLWSCPAIPISRGRSQSSLLITCWPTSRCFSATSGGWRTASSASTCCPSAAAPLPGCPIPPTGSSLPRELGFSAISANSMDAVSDRDFVVEFMAAAALCMMHFSRMSEELILWASGEFGFIRLAEEFTTGSSIMPQKRNPDFAELARGKTGRVYGHLMGLLTTLKGLPLTYNRDLQEDKEGFFDTVDTLQTTIAVFAAMLPGLALNAGRVESLAGESGMLATDLADYLVGKGMPFREAHGVMRELCRYCDEQGIGLQELPVTDYQRYSPLFEGDVYRITAAASASARDVPGGTAPGRVAEALARAEQILGEAGDGV